MPDHSDRTEKPTPQRVEKARKEGRFPTSREFVSTFQFVAFVAMLGSWSESWLPVGKALLRTMLEQAFAPDFGATRLVSMLHFLSQQVIWPVLRAGLLIALVSVAVHLAITRFGFSFERLSFDPSRLDPLKRLRELPKQNGPATIQALLMLALFGWFFYQFVRQNAQLLFFLPLSRPEVAVREIAVLLMDLFWKIAAIFALFGAVDLFRQLRRFNKEMRMSRQEIKDEMKQSEGDPQVKFRIRRIQRDSRRRRMMSEVPTATAVIVNPTHYAVALRYRHDEMATPVVVAKGKNYLALRIRQKAIENNVPLVENPPLAQALYKTVDIGQEIPPQLYRAVAEVLAYIYQLMNDHSFRKSPSPHSGGHGSARLPGRPLG